MSGSGIWDGGGRRSGRERESEWKRGWDWEREGCGLWREERVGEVVGEGVGEEIKYCGINL